MAKAAAAASASSGSVVPATVPDAPAQPTLTHGNAQLTVAFVAPADGSSAITGYTANCTSSNGGAAGSNTGATSPIVVAALTNGKTYTCTVFATNDVGDGLASPASSAAIPATVPAVPAAPTADPGQHLDLGGVRRPRQRWECDYRLHGELRVERRRCHG